MVPLIIRTTDIEFVRVALNAVETCIGQNDHLMNRSIVRWNVTPRTLALS